jgi:hypothetical protein
MRASIKANPIRPDRGISAYVWIALSLFFVFIVLWRLPPQRVGDGSEYYAMYLAWLETLRPWMSVTSFNAYQQLFLSNSIVGLVPGDSLANSFPALKLGASADFNHFWFYSFLAFSVAKVMGLFGVALEPHTAFLGLHFLLLTVTAMVAHRLYGKSGLATVLLMTLFSPMLWFFDKVHSELFTYCFTLMGVMFVFSNRYLLAAFCLAMASTQNPSFALVAFFPFMYHIVQRRAEKFTLIEVCLVVATALAVLAHPVYYFLRFGVLTPQLLAGGASLGGNLSTFYIWILDPDLGLLPNWPLGVVLTLAALVFRVFSSERAVGHSNLIFYVFCAIFLLVNFYAHSSTTNLNSGATPGLARYSLWYLPIWFPIVYYVVRKLPKNRFLAVVLLVPLVLIGLVSVSKNNPKRAEQYSRPTWISNAIQTRLPSFYTPPAEIFLERYSGYGEGIYRFNPLGVLGPDCRKLLIISGQDRQLITTPPHCHVDEQKLQALVRTFENQSSDHFVNLSDSNYRDVLRKLAPGEYSIGTAGTGNFMLYSGWYDLESWGVWSRNKKASLSFPCNDGQFYSSKSTLNVVLGFRSYGTQEISITQGGDSLFEGVLKEPVDVSVQAAVFKCNNNSIDLDINVKKPMSPAEVGESNDQRNIGVGLSKITVLP